MLEDIRTIVPYVPPVLGALKAVQILPTLMKRFNRWRKNHENNKEARLREQLRRFDLYLRVPLMLNAANEKDKIFAIWTWIAAALLFAMLLVPGKIGAGTLTALLVEMGTFVLFGFLSWHEAAQRIRKCENPAKTRLDIALEIQVTRLKATQKKLKAITELIDPDDVTAHSITVPSLKDWHK